MTMQERDGIDRIVNAASQGMAEGPGDSQRAEQRRNSIAFVDMQG